MTISTLSARPGKKLIPFVQSFWMLENPSDQEVETTVLPDGMVDLFIFRSGHSPYQVALKGVETAPSQTVIVPKIKMFAIGFKPLAIEYLFHTQIAHILNEAMHIHDPWWQFSEADLDDFDKFVKTASQKIADTLTTPVDTRKKELFDLIFEHNGALTVQELSEKVFWSARQINRYFNQQFGLSLKAYCNIIRFRASFEQIKHGKLFPEQNFFDQAHFIKEVKKLSGVAPKELKDNKNDRFLQLSILPGK